MQSDSGTAAASAGSPLVGDEEDDEYEVRRYLLSSHCARALWSLHAT
jgi:hypothetical protein